MRFLSAVLDELRQQRRHDRLMKALGSARQQLDQGDAEPMQRIADEFSLGDAWTALAGFHARQPDLRSEILATEAYRQACRCIFWLDHSGSAHAEYDRRRFLGIGVVPDYPALADEWAAFQAHGRELQLAWILTYGPEAMRDLRGAAWWTCLSDARWGPSREAELPSRSAVELRAQLASALPEAVLAQLRKDAHLLAHQEFVQGK
jgi:hypothetical protein